MTFDDNLNKGFQPGINELLSYYNISTRNQENISNIPRHAVIFSLARSLNAYVFTSIIKKLRV